MNDYFFLMMISMSFLLMTSSCNDRSIDLAKSDPNGVTRIQQIVESPTFQFDDTTRILCTSNGAEPNLLSFNAQQEIYSLQFYARQNDLLSVTLDGAHVIDTVVLLFKYLDQDNSTTSRPTLELIASDDDGATGGLSSLSYLFSESQLYVLMISSWHGLSIGEIDVMMNVIRSNDDETSGVDVCTKMVNRCHHIDGVWDRREQRCVINDSDASMNHLDTIRTRCDKFCRLEVTQWFDRCIMSDQAMKICRDRAGERGIKCFERCIEESCAISTCLPAQ